MKKTIAILTCFFLVFSISSAQSKFEKATSDAAKLEKKVKQDFKLERGKNGKGYAPYYPALGAPPKKVALISFAISDPGYSTSNPSNTSFKSVSTMEGYVKQIVQAYYGVALEPLKKKFAEYGMDLLTPDEFLDTDEKKGFYMEYDFTPKEHFFNKMSVTASYVRTAAEGYRYILPMHEGTFFKSSEKDYVYYMLQFTKKDIYEQLGYEMCKGLDVDAVLMVSTTLMYQSVVRTDIKYVTMVMFGLNPISLEPGAKEGVLYRKGNIYGSYRLPISAPVKDDEDPAGNVETDGYANIMIALSNNLGKWLVEQTSKPDKR